MDDKGLKVLEEFREYIYCHKLPLFGFVQIEKAPDMKFCGTCGKELVYEKESEGFDGNTGDVRVFEQLRCKTPTKYKGWWIFAKYRDCLRAPIYRVYAVKRSK